MSSNGGKFERRMSRRLAALLGAVSLISATVLAGGGPAQAVPTGLFEIADGNVVDATGTPPDWGSMFGRTPTNTAGAPVSVVNAQGMEGAFFVEDMTVGDDLPSPPCDPGQTGDLTVLTGAGSDTNGDALSTWTWTAGNVPAHKDDITNFYGAAAIDDNGNRVLYFGLERSDSSGTSHLDVEFLQSPMNQTVTGTNATNGCPEGSFAGVRTIGDVLLVLDYSGGAVLDEVRVWDGDSYELPLDGGGNPVNLATIAGLAHNGAGAIDCGDWNCRTPTAVTTTLAAGTFLEGFLDFTALTKAMGKTAPASDCFAAFNAKSRSSSTWTSQLKDIALAEIDACDANISISPSGVNEVGTNHTLTGTVKTNAAGTFVNAADGTTINFSILGGGPGSFVGGLSSCTTAGGTGSCSVAITSTTVGTTVVAASTTVQVGPKSVTRTTDGNAGPGGSGNASKIWADGSIKVTASETNPVNEAHVFVVEFGVQHGTGGTLGLPTITPSVTPTPNGGVSHNCATPTTVSPGLWQCTVTINSSTAGAFVASATGSATVSGAGTPSSATITRTTSVGTTATKTYVTADISITPDGAHEVGSTTPLTGTVFVNPSTGRVPAPDGTVISFVIASGPGALSAPSCVTTGGTGSCTVNISSATAGTSIIGATSNVSVGGLTLPVSTDANSPNSAAATKHWTDALVTIGPAAATNPLNDPHEFTVTVTALPGGATPVSFSSVAPTVTPTPGTSSHTCATPTVNGNTATCTVTINSAEAGVFTANVTAVVQAGGVSMVRSTNDAVAGAGPGGSGPAVKTYAAGQVADQVLGVTVDAPRAGGLARTGTEATTIVYFGAGLVFAGAVLVGTARRLRPSTRSVSGGRATRS